MKMEIFNGQQKYFYWIYNTTSFWYIQVSIICETVLLETNQKTTYSLSVS